MASPSPPREDAADAVCCMCGDRGLPRELLRCRSCRVRVQHSYCSDLYPRAAAYSRCNWCLREPAAEGEPGGAGHASAVANCNKQRPKETKRKTTTSASDEERQRQRRAREGCSRRPAEPGRPLKKKHKDDEKTMPPPPPPPPGAGTKGSGTGEKVMQAGKARVRVKVRRYKLLAEVISC